MSSFVSLSLFVNCPIFNVYSSHSAFGFGSLHATLATMFTIKHRKSKICPQGHSIRKMKVDKRKRERSAIQTPVSLPLFDTIISSCSYTRTKSARATHPSKIIPYINIYVNNNKNFIFIYFILRSFNLIAQLYG